MDTSYRAVDAAIDALRSDLLALDPTLRDAAMGTMSTRMYLAQYRQAHHVAAMRARGGDLLDWGAGIGHFAHVQHRLGARVTAYSIQPNEYNIYNDVLHRLADAGGFRVVLGDDPVALPFEDASFDVVVSCGVLEHVREFGGDDVASLREIRRLLRPGGAFVCLHLPNAQSWIERTNRALGRSHHAFTYSAADLRRLEGGSGLRIVRHHRYGVLPKISIAKVRAIAESWPAVRAWYGLDALAGALLGRVAQNHFLVMERPASG